jgi:hypothetical protein
MKKQAAILMAIFYLALTSGMYACLVSCGSNHLKELIAANQLTVAADAKEIHCHDSGEKDCHKDKECDCCKKHGNYSVKENLKPSVAFTTFNAAASQENLISAGFSISCSIALGIAQWQNTNGAPPGIQVPIFIKNSSFLI